MPITALNVQFKVVSCPQSFLKKTEPDTAKQRDWFAVGFGRRLVNGTTVFGKALRNSGPVVLIAFGLFGCGTRVPPTVPPLAGNVTLDGKPVAAATVLFVPQGSAVPTATAITTSEGNFELRLSGAEKEIPAGQYKVMIMDPDPKSKVPPLYKDPTKTPLSATVPPTGKYQFKLKG